MALKPNFEVTPIAAATKAVAAPKTAPHLASNEDLLSRLKVYGTSKEGQFKLCIDGPTVPFNAIHNTVEDTWGNVGASEGFDKNDENDKETVRAHYFAKLSTDEMAMAQARLALEVRAARLAAEKAQKAADEIGRKAFKASLAVKAEHGEAAVALADSAA